MLSDARPLLFLDVDGVLIPYAAEGQPDGFVMHRLLDEQVWLAPHHGEWLRPLCDRFQLVWATGWEHEANRLIGPILGLPVLPVIEFPRDATGRFEKFPTIARVTAGRPFVWIDDELTPAIHTWALQHQPAALLIDSDPAIGLTLDMIATIAGFPQTLETV